MYVPAFLRWQLLAKDVATNRGRFTQLVDSVADKDAYPGVLLSETLAWDAIQPQFMELAERPVLIGDLSVGACGDPTLRLQVDTMHRPGGPMPCDEQDIFPSTLGKNVSVAGLTGDQVCLSYATDFAPETHETEVMRVQWGGVLPAGEVRWQVELSLLGYSFLSLRVGQRRPLTSPPETATSVDLLLRTEDEQGVSFMKSVRLRPILQQDVTTGGASANLMRTFRVPLSDLAERGALLARTKELILRFPPEAVQREVLVDSIEFTKDYPEMGMNCKQSG